MISIDNLAVQFGALRVLDSISLEAKTGTVMAVLGPSGAGKSTLLRAVRGWIEPSAGGVLLDGLPVHKWPTKALAQKCAYVSQNPELNLALTVAEVASLNQLPGLRICPRVSPPSAVNKALELMGVAHLASRIFPSLSYGEQRRVQVARAIAHALESSGGPAKYLLLDEPEAELSWPQKKQLIALLNALAGKGTTVVLTMNDLSLACLLRSAMVLLDQGRIVAQGAGDSFLTLELLRKIYGVELIEFRCPKSRTCMWVPAAFARRGKGGCIS